MCSNIWPELCNASRRLASREGTFSSQATFVCDHLTLPHDRQEYFRLEIDSRTRMPKPGIHRSA